MQRAKADPCDAAASMGQFPSMEEQAPARPNKTGGLVQVLANGIHQGFGVSPQRPS